ncbi:MAG: hypothetical protein EBR23_01505 [Planctomycetia bacterium]|nr:hypothetical protein [Planctomycetia bacterium]
MTGEPQAIDDAAVDALIGDDPPGVPTAGESDRLAEAGSRLTADYDTSMAAADLPIWAPTPEKMQAAIERLVAAQPT